MAWPAWTTVALLVLEFSIRVGLALRVLMRRRDPGVTFAWLALILFVPLLGVGAYLLVGENRLARRRAEREVIQGPPYRALLDALSSNAHAEVTRLRPTERRLAAHARALTSVPVQGGSHAELVDDPIVFLERLAREIDAAQHEVLVQFYIAQDAGAARDVLLALERAAQRGVRVRVMLDAVGSKQLLESPAATRLRNSGIRLVTQLPIGLVRMLFSRIDLRSHRKLVVIDSRRAVMGSQNLVDPRAFKQDAGVGQWVDASCVLEGPIVRVLQTGYLFDWELETGEDLSEEIDRLAIDEPPRAGEGAYQLIPSGPGLSAASQLRVMTAAIYAAEHEVVLTSPYFVPDHAILSAIIAAARRGVRVAIILPEKSDSVLVNLASGAMVREALHAGAEVYAFRDGLLHTKSITIDREFALFGTSNLDNRSFWLNFEHTLAVYDDRLTHDIRTLQDTYIARSTRLDPTARRARTFTRRLAESAAYVFSPLL
ncbi:MAG: cardiolipin synthase [Phycisphaerales bacterium]|jgi:cardiolipin synthase|nr:cardiolipin synthase [Phycisphaerales bacterium]